MELLTNKVGEPVTDKKGCHIRKGALVVDEQCLEVQSPLASGVVSLASGDGVNVTLRWREGGADKPKSRDAKHLTLEGTTPDDGRHRHTGAAFEAGLVRLEQLHGVNDAEMEDVRRRFGDHAVAGDADDRVPARAESPARRAQKRWLMPHADKGWLWLCGSAQEPCKGE